MDTQCTHAHMIGTHQHQRQSLHSQCFSSLLFSILPLFIKRTAQENAPWTAARKRSFTPLVTFKYMPTRSKLIKTSESLVKQPNQTKPPRTTTQTQTLLSLFTMQSISLFPFLSFSSCLLFLFLFLRIACFQSKLVSGGARVLGVYHHLNTEYHVGVGGYFKLLAFLQVGVSVRILDVF